MKSKIISFCLVFSMLFFASFASENKSEILPKKEVSETKIKSQKKNLVQSKKQKFNFKERLALKLIKKKIKKAQKRYHNHLENNNTMPFILFVFLQFLIVVASLLFVLLVTYWIWGSIATAIITAFLASWIVVPLMWAWRKKKYASHKFLKYL